MKVKFLEWTLIFLISMVVLKEAVGGHWPSMLVGIGVLVFLAISILVREARRSQKVAREIFDLLGFWITIRVLGAVAVVFAIYHGIRGDWVGFWVGMVFATIITVAILFWHRLPQALYKYLEMRWILKEELLSDEIFANHPSFHRGTLFGMGSDGYGYVLRIAGCSLAVHTSKILGNPIEGARVLFRLGPEGLIWVVTEAWLENEVSRLMSGPETTIWGKLSDLAPGQDNLGFVVAENMFAFNALQAGYEGPWEEGLEVGFALDQNRRIVKIWPIKNPRQ